MEQGAAPKVSFVSLGCPKALVDSERIITRLRAEGYALTDIWPDILGVAGATLPRALPALFLSITLNFLICLFQTDIGLSLGVWIRDWMMRASADGTRRD